MILNLMSKFYIFKYLEINLIKFYYRSEGETSDDDGNAGDDDDDDEEDTEIEEEDDDDDEDKQLDPTKAAQIKKL